MIRSKNLAIMFTDMKDFTQYITHASRPESIERIQKHENLLLPVLDHFGGTLVKTIGDSFLVTFESPTNAVLAGMDLQRTLREHNAALTDPNKRMEIRVAINTGEVTLTETDVYGEAVNIASRILGIAEANEVYFTEAVYLSMNKREVPSSEIGFRHLKGVPEKVKIYKVLTEPVPQGTPLRSGSTVAGQPRSSSGFAQPAGAVAAQPPVERTGSTPAAPPSGLSGSRQSDTSDALRAGQILEQPSAGSVPEQPVVGSLPGQIPASPSVQSGFLFPAVPYPVASFGRRLAAFAIDLLLLQVIIGSLRAHEGWFFFYALYFLGLWTLRGETIGKMILGLKILKEDGSRLTFMTALVRYIGYYLSSLPLLLGFLWAAWDEKRQTWHDKIAGTCVVKVRGS